MDFSLCEKLISEYAENYMEKVFYFSLKKTGSVDEAENLASDITLNILNQLKKGNIPQYFSAWVWKIARNRYSLWAESKKKAAMSFTGEDISELEIKDERETAEENLIKEDELSLL